MKKREPVIWGPGVITAGLWAAAMTGVGLRVDGEGEGGGSVRGAESATVAKRKAKSGIRNRDIVACM